MMHARRYPIVALVPMVLVGLVVMCTAAVGTVAHSQPPSAPGLDGQPDVSPLEIQRMFDAYALVQAQDQLKLSSDQYPPFVARFKSLQEVRRRSQAERGRVFRELARLSRLESADEAAFRDQLKALQDVETRSAAEIKQARDAVDQVLDVRQQARFRVFEEMMERRKIELVTRARQNNRFRRQ